MVKKINVPPGKDLKKFVLDRIPNEFPVLLRYVQESDYRKMLRHGSDRYETLDIDIDNEECKICISNREYMDEINEKKRCFYSGLGTIIESHLDGDGSDIGCPAYKLLDRDTSYINAYPINDGEGLEWLFNVAQTDASFISVYNADKMEEYKPNLTGCSYRPKKGFTFKDCLVQVFVIKD